MKSRRACDAWHIYRKHLRSVYDRAIGTWKDKERSVFVTMDISTISLCLKAKVEVLREHVMCSGAMAFSQFYVTVHKNLGRPGFFYFGKKLAILIIIWYNDYRKENMDVISMASKRYNTETFVQAAMQVHGDKYDYSQVVYEGIKTKVIIRCKKHDCVFEQTPEMHLKGYDCPQCAVEKRKETMKQKHGVEFAMQSRDIKTKAQRTREGKFGQNKVPGSGRKKMTKEDFVERARAVHGFEYDYSNAVVSGYGAKVEIICLEHGSFFQSPAKHLAGHGCPHKDCVNRRREFTNLKHRGVKNPMQSHAVQRKQAMNKPAVSRVTSFEPVFADDSNLYDVMYDKLCSVFTESSVLRDYKNCGYYVEFMDLYIDFYFESRHGGHWFDRSDAIDLDRVQAWMNSDDPRLRDVVDAWTKQDVDKRLELGRNKSNYVVFWDSKFRDFDLWVSLNCPDGQDYVKEYSWLPERNGLSVDKVVFTGTLTNLTQVAKRYQFNEFYKREIDLWTKNPVWRDGLSVQVSLYHNRLKYLGKKPDELTDFEIARGFGILRMVDSYSSFSASLMDKVIKEYGFKSIYDPCAGWGERMLYCKAHDIKYWGVDINKGLKPGYVDMMVDLDITDQDVVFADSSKVKLYGQYDCVLTCPPYFNQEIYSEDGAENLGQDEFLDWWKAVVENSLQLDPKYFCVQLNQKCLVKLVPIIESCGFEVVDRFDAKIQASHMNKRNVKREFESMVVLKRK